MGGPPLKVVDSEAILVSQLKAFRPDRFPHLVESFHGARSEVPSSRPCALFIRDGRKR